MKKRKKMAKPAKPARAPDNPFDRMMSLAETGSASSATLVTTGDLRTILRFAKYHRMWRLMIGYNDTKKVPLDGKRLDNVDKKRIKYYAKLFGIDPTALHESIHTHDAPAGGGNRAKKAARNERTLSRAGLKTTLSPRTR